MFAVRVFQHWSFISVERDAFTLFAFSEKSLNKTLRGRELKISPSLLETFLKIIYVGKSDRVPTKSRSFMTRICDGFSIPPKAPLWPPYTPLNVKNIKILSVNGVIWIPFCNKNWLNCYYTTYYTLFIELIVSSTC